MISKLLELRVWLYRVSGGKIGGKVSGFPVLLLTGRIGLGPRVTTPMPYLPQGQDRYLLMDDCPFPLTDGELVEMELKTKMVTAVVRETDGEKACYELGVEEISRKPHQGATLKCLEVW